MRLAGFYGLTAPFVILLYREAGAKKLADFCEKLNNYSDKDNIEFAKCELMYFKKAIDRIPLLRKSEMDEYFTDAEEIAYCNCGKLSGYKGDAGVLMGKVKRGIMVRVAEELLDSSLNNFIAVERFSNVKIRNCIADAVTDFIGRESFSIGAIPSVAKKISRKFINRRKMCKDTAELERLNKKIMSEFRITLECSDTVVVNGNTVVLTDDERKVLQYFVCHKCDIDTIIKLLNTSGANSVEIFGSRFTDLMQRKPTYLFSVVARELNLGDSMKAQFLIKSHNDILEQLLEFKRLFNENMALVSESCVFGLQPDEALEIVDKFPGDASDIRALINRNAICTENLDEQTLQAVMELGNIISGMDVEKLNRCFSVSLTVAGWEDCIDKMNSLGIYGLNLYSRHLFNKFLANSTLNLLDKIIITERLKTEFEHVISEIEALLNTLKPIGGRVDEKLTHL